MSCFYCKYYNGLEHHCNCDVLVETGSESFDCNEYEYNGEVTE